MWLMLQQPKGDDYVISTGETHSVREFLDEAFGLVKRDWKEFVKIDPKYLRPTEVDSLIGDASRASDLLGWVPKIHAPRLAQIMVDADRAALETEGTHYVDSVVTE